MTCSLTISLSKVKEQFLSETSHSFRLSERGDYLHLIHAPAKAYSLTELQNRERHEKLLVHTATMLPLAAISVES
jgi:hypothetical protein